MLLTISIKLLTEPEQKKSLLNSMYQFNSACNWISEVAFANKAFSKKTLHKLVYYEAREKFSLPAQFAIRTIGRVLDSYKTNKKTQHQFKKTSSIEYDKNGLSWKNLDSISISTIDKRLKNIPIQYGKYIDLKNKVIRNSAKLVYKKSNFYLQCSVEQPETTLTSYTDFIGVDLGIVNLAYTSENKSYSGQQVETVRKHYVSLRSRLQKANTKSAKRHLKKLSGKEKNFKKNTNHIISKQIVASAKALNKGIGLEDLILFKQTVRKAERDKHGKWAFYQLANYIEYKAKIAGVEVIRIDRKNTSRTCSNCGFCSKNNRITQEKFKCKKCKFQINADYNAAINISRKAVIKQNQQRALVNKPIVAKKI
jgi:IS605 OrfB family transposase